MASNPADQDEIISQFCAMTGTGPSEAAQFLDANYWDIGAAVAEFFTEPDDAQQEMNDGGEGQLDLDEVPQHQSSHTLARDPLASASAASAQSSGARGPSERKFATLGDLTSSGAGADSADDDDMNQDFFAGGEKSGLAVQNPDEIKRRIIDKARNALPPDESKPKKSHFTGTARTLGGDGIPSQVIRDPNEGRSQQPPKVRRTLHFWSDGFSVDDGDLYRSDDPRNAEILEGIRRGRAPLSIMNVDQNQEVDVHLQQHDSKYVKPKTKYKPFAGPGQRLGSPTPALRSASQPATAVPSVAAEPPKPELDETQPTVTVQIRLGDGTRLTSRFNTTHTIGDIYSFVSAASPRSQTRTWVLMTTFPSKELTDKAATLGDLPDFKRGGVVVQKWQ